MLYISFMVTSKQKFIIDTQNIEKGTEHARVQNHQITDEREENDLHNSQNQF